MVTLMKYELGKDLRFDTMTNILTVAVCSQQDDFIYQFKNQ